MPPEINGTDEVVQKILTSGCPDHLNYEGVKEERLKYAVSAVDRFKALGASDREIAKIFAGVKLWVKGMYPSVELEIMRRRIGRGLNNDNLNDLVMQNAAKRKVEMLKAQIIAQDELSKVIDLTSAFDKTNI